MREGGTRFEILSAVASFESQQAEPPRQTDVTEMVSVTRGTVSKTCSALVDEGLLLEEEGEYRVNDDMLLLLYKEHLEPYLVRDSANNGFADRVEARNELRIDLKGELRQLVMDDTDGRRDLMVDLLREVLVYALRFREIQTFRDFLFATDHVIRTIAAHVVTHQQFDEANVATDDEIRLLLLITVALDRGYAVLDRLQASHPGLDAFLPGEPPEERMIEYLTTQ